MMTETTANSAFGVSTLGTIFLLIKDAQAALTMIATMVTIVCGVLAAVLYVLKIIQQNKINKG